MDACCPQPWLQCHLPAWEVRDSERELLAGTQDGGFVQAAAQNGWASF